MLPRTTVSLCYVGTDWRIQRILFDTSVYIKAKEYSDFENRDIWEYRLNLTEDQMQRLLMHGWGLGNRAFDYFYFNENCAYQILSLLDVADPELQLAERFWFYTFPSDGIRMIADKPGLVKT